MGEVCFRISVRVSFRGFHMREISEGVDAGFAGVLDGSEEILEPDDVSVEIRDVRVVDGETDVVKDKVDDLVVPVQDVEDGLFALPDLMIEKTDRLFMIIKTSL